MIGEWKKQIQAKLAELEQNATRLKSDKDFILLKLKTYRDPDLSGLFDNEIAEEENNLSDINQNIELTKKEMKKYRALIDFIESEYPV